MHVKMQYLKQFEKWESNWRHSALKLSSLDKTAKHVSVSQRCACVSPLFINSLQRNLLARQDILPQLQHKQIPVGKNQQS